MHQLNSVVQPVLQSLVTTFPERNDLTVLLGQAVGASSSTGNQKGTEFIIILMEELLTRWSDSTEKSKMDLAKGIDMACDRLANDDQHIEIIDMLRVVEDLNERIKAEYKWHNDWVQLLIDGCAWLLSFITFYYERKDFFIQLEAA